MAGQGRERLGLADISLRQGCNNAFFDALDDSTGAGNGGIYQRERFGAGDRRIRSQDDCFETRLFMPKAQQGMKIRNIDPVLALQSMTYYLTDRKV